MSIISAYVREDWYYSVNDLKSIFSFDAMTYGSEDEAKRRFKIYIKELLSRNILKNKKKSSADKADIEFRNYDDSDLVKENKRYKFNFVGIVICQSRIAYVYPKYIGTASALPTYEPREELAQVIKVIEKYSKEKSKQDIRNVNFFVDEDDKGKINILSVMLFLLEDYASNGSYESDEAIIEINGSSDIFWEKTIDETCPIISDNRPLYVEMYTRKNVNDDCDYVKRLHECVITCCSREIDNAGLYKFFSLPYVEVSEDEIDSFGDIDYIIGHLDTVISITYDDRKISVLKAIKLYLKSSHILDGDTGIQLIGTRTFNLIWEEVCAKVFKSQKGDKTRHPNVTEIEPQIDYTLINKNFNKKPPTLIELIRQPVWKKYKKGSKGLTTSTLKPDYVRFESTSGSKYIFYILDAKYYCPIWADSSIKEQPGVEDVIKQYLYYLAYRDILEKYKVTEVKNYFLMPKRGCDSEVAGFVKLDMLKELGLGVVEVRMLSPVMMYDHYLNNESLPLTELH
ncbi:MAG: LlaJI family restriction endonuclease [Lachnospiraceae bacterium]|nr:LlaJI family restriction endonuclease [Lachnospiraceae bacterium]